MVFNRAGMAHAAPMDLVGVLVVVIDPSIDAIVVDAPARRASSINARCTRARRLCGR